MNPTGLAVLNGDLVREALRVALGVLEEKDEGVGDDGPAGRAALGSERAVEPLPFLSYALDEFHGTGVTLDSVLPSISHLADPPRVDGLELSKLW